MKDHNGPPSVSLCVSDVSPEFLYSLYRTDFRSFMRKAFLVLYGPGSLHDNWHLDAIAFALMQVGPEAVLRQMFFMPPRSMKSLIVSVFWVAWQLGRDPRKKIWVVSHSVDLAKDLHKTFRDLISHPEIQAIFPALKSCLTIDNDSEVRTGKGGGRWALSVNGNVTGRGADLIIIDDPVDAKHANSEAERERVSTWILKTLWSRMNHPARTPVVLVMQRLHLDDPAPHLQKVSDWQVLQLPAVFRKDTLIQVDDDVFREVKAGELLHPEHLPQKVLDERQIALGKHAYSAQYLQAPVPEGGGMIDLSEFRRYKNIPAAYDAKILSVDCATGGDVGSYTAMIGARVYKGHLLITSVLRRRIDIPTQLEIITNTQEQSDLDHIVVENAHAGMAVVQQLKKHYRSKKDFRFRRNFIEAVTPKGSKEVRMEAMMKYVRTGRILLPEKAPWLDDFEHELAAFPNGKYDDQVDALSQLIMFYEFFMGDPCLRISRGLDPMPIE